eukprot:TRINITY_DN103627_c0_g1_i1.p1 TRINITY_DN103627_c0_g1~~TRINITY_DN103627_c0_g1_i1.p1  ORF type:complete len:172 (-),score=3.37 TRINITY_DN103627_c0_g1_i1:206-697(-)
MLLRRLQKMFKPYKARPPSPRATSRRCGRSREPAPRCRISALSSRMFRVTGTRLSGLGGVQQAPGNSARKSTRKRFHGAEVFRSAATRTVDRQCPVHRCVETMWTHVNDLVCLLRVAAASAMHSGFLRVRTFAYSGLPVGEALAYHSGATQNSGPSVPDVTHM